MSFVLTAEFDASHRLVRGARIRRDWCVCDVLKTEFGSLETGQDGSLSNRR